MSFHSFGVTCCSQEKLLVPLLTKQSGERERSEETGLDKLCAVCEFDAESKTASVRQEKPQFSRKATQSHTYGPEEGNSESVSRHKSGSDRSR